MNPSELRVAFFSGNYNYVRDGANQAQNLLVGHLLDRGVAVRVYSPTTPTPDRKSTRLNSSHSGESRMPSSA